MTARTCERLLPKDAEVIARAQRDYLSSPEAIAKFNAPDLDAARVRIGSASVSRVSGEAPIPQLGAYHASQPELKAVQFRTTVHVSKAGRWGLTFSLQRVDSGWKVLSLSHWHARHLEQGRSTR